MLSRAFPLLAVMLALAPPLPAQEKAAKDWPVFRGNGMQTGLAASDLPKELAVLWSIKTDDPVQGSPVIADQTVFVGALDGKLYALELGTGKKKWTYQATAIKVAPAVRAGAVYFGDSAGVFHCVDAVTGKRRWILETKRQIVSSANFAQDKILFGSDDHHLYCISSQGKIIWQLKTKEKIQACPAVSGDRVFVAGCDQTLHVIDLAKGTALASIPLGGHIGASVAVSGDHVYVGSMANRFLAIDWKKEALLWHFEAKRFPQAFFSSAALTDEWVVAGSRDKHVRAWHRQTGKEAWSFATKGRVDSSPVIVDQRVLIGSVDGHLYVLDLLRGTELARFELGAITNSVAVGGQCVIVATAQGDIVCLGGKR